MGFCVLQSFGYSFIARGFNTGRIQSILVLPAPLSRRPGIRQFYQGKSLGHSPSRIPRTGNNQRSVKEKAAFSISARKSICFRCKPNSRRACAVMKSSIVLPPGCQPYSPCAMKPRITVSRWAEPSSHAVVKIPSN